jgi:hypothetical protein
MDIGASLCRVATLALLGWRAGLGIPMSEKASPGHCPGLSFIFKFQSEASFSLHIKIKLILHLQASFF